MNTHSNQPVFGLELLLRCLIIIDQRKARAPSTTKVCPEAEGYDAALLSLIEGGELLGELGLGDVGA